MGKIIKNGNTYGVSYGDLYDIGYYPSKTWWVDSDNGDDNNDGRTINTPFRTLVKAMKMVAPGAQWADAGTLSTERININCEATTPYDNLLISNKQVRVYAWNFSNNTDAQATGTIKITGSTTQSAVQVYRGNLWLYTKGLTIVNANGAGLHIGQQSSCWINNNAATTVCTISINSYGDGIKVAENSSLYIFGQQGANSSISATSSNSVGIIVTSNSYLNTRCSITAVGRSSGILVEYNAAYLMNSVGAASNNLCVVTASSTYNSSAISINSGGTIYCNGDFMKYVLTAPSGCTNACIYIMGGRLMLRATYLTATQNATSRPCVMLVGGEAFFNCPSSGTCSFTSPSNSTNHTINASWGGRISFGGGSSNALPTINGKYGLCAEVGGVVTYANIKNNATTTATTARSGGRIYSGNQSSIPNY